jgi:hypothetical protein
MEERVFIPTSVRSLKRCIQIYARLKLDNSPFFLLWVLGKDVPFVQTRRTGKTAVHSASCGKPVCPEHRSVMCSGCVDILREQLVIAAVESLISKKNSHIFYLCLF